MMKGIPKSPAVRAAVVAGPVGHAQGIGRALRWTRAAGALAVAVVALARPAGAEAARVDTGLSADAGRASDSRNGPAPAGCTRAEEQDPILRAVSEALLLGSEAQIRDALAALEPEARRLAEASPDDAHAQYRLAAVIGARVDHEGGAAKVTGAKALHAQLLEVFELSPGHPGASYIMGRLHVGVMRLDRVTRFLATRLLGGEALGKASWEEAQAMLERAAHAEPCVPDHHYELARLYARRGDMPAAERALALVKGLTAGRDGRDAHLRERAERLEKELRLP